MALRLPSRIRSIGRAAALVVTLALALASKAAALPDEQARPGGPLSGTWRRGQGEEAKYYQLEDDGTRVLGELLAVSRGDFSSYRLELSREGGLLRGSARWAQSWTDEQNVTYTFQTQSGWELEVVDENTIRGRLEYVVWDLPTQTGSTVGRETERGWEEHTFTRLPRLD